MSDAPKNNETVSFEMIMHGAPGVTSVCVSTAVDPWRRIHLPVHKIIVNPSTSPLPKAAANMRDTSMVLVDMPHWLADGRGLFARDDRTTYMFGGA